KMRAYGGEPPRDPGPADRLARVQRRGRASLAPPEVHPVHVRASPEGPGPGARRASFPHPDPPGRRDGFGRALSADTPIAGRRPPLLAGTRRTQNRGPAKLRHEGDGAQSRPRDSSPGGPASSGPRLSGARPAADISNTPVSHLSCILTVHTV